MRTGTGYENKRKIKYNLCIKNTEVVTKQQAAMCFNVEGTYKGVIELLCFSVKCAQQRG